MARQMKIIELLSFFRKCLYLGVLSLFFVLVFANFVQAGWNVQTVDTIGDVGGYSSVALDSNGYPHISYYDATNKNLKYAKWTGSSWSIQTVDNAGSVGIHTSIALDGNGYPHISYRDATNDSLKYAKWTGSSWSIETIDTSWGNYSSIALDSSGYAHIAYFDWDPNYNAKYAYWTGSSWNIQSINTPEADGWHTSIGLDPGNSPHISFTTEFQELRYAYWTGSSWDIQNVDSDVWDASIAVDSNSYPHISYHETNQRLKYAKWTGSSWYIESVDSAGNVGIHSSITLESNGYPHISYCDVTNYNLKYVHWTGSSWDIQIVGSIGSADISKSGTSIALDADGNPHISYYHDTSQDLKYAKWVPPQIDLVVTSVDAPSSATERDIINVSNTVKNQGDTSAGSFYVYFYLSPDTTITTSDTKIGERYVSSLSAGASSSANTYCTLPSGLTGSYYVGAIVDATGWVSESNENNNTGYDSTPIDISPAPPGPDLVVISIDAPSSATTGDSVNVWNTIKNEGDTSASSFYVYFYLSANATITTSDTKIGERYVSSLSAGASSSANTSCTLPSGLTGSYYVGAIVDATSWVSESNENNNAGYDATPIDINPGPIIQVSSSFLDFGEVEKDITEVTKIFTISNSGEGTLSGTITSDRNWIGVEPGNFNSNYVRVTVTVYTGPLQAFIQYTGTVTVDSNGGIGTVTVSIVPTCVKPYPNPYSLSSGKPLTFWGTGVPHATIKIYTLSGELVKTLKETKGEDKITWDGRNEDGDRVVRGIYFFTTKNPREKNRGKFTIVR